MPSRYETPFALSLRPGEAEDPNLEEDRFLWNSWRQRNWPLEIIEPGLRFYGFDPRSRCLRVLFEVTSGRSFTYRSIAEFCREVEDATGWSPRIDDPRYPLKRPSRGQAYYGLALTWKVIRKVDIPFSGRFPRLGWARLRGQTTESVVKVKRANSQGFAITADERKTLDVYAMNRARIDFGTKGFTVRDDSRTMPYDLYCTRHRVHWFVEVKGTQSTGAEIILTKNEVEYARQFKPHMALCVVHSIKLIKTSNGFRAEGGELKLIQPWDIDQGTLQPIQFKYKPA